MVTPWAGVSLVASEVVKFARRTYCYTPSYFAVCSLLWRVVCDRRCLFWLLCFALISTNGDVRCSIAAAVKCVCVFFFSWRCIIDWVLRSTPGTALAQ